MKASTRVTTQTIVHFTWTEEEIAELLRKEVDKYLEFHYSKAAFSDKAAFSVDVQFGSVYEGGVEARATATATMESPK